MRKPQILVLIQLVLFTVLVGIVIMIPTERNTLWILVGLLLMICGVVVGLVAIMQHPGGPKISPEPKQRAQLIQTGLYRYVRHPIYTGVLLATLGAAIFHNHPATYGIFGILVAFFSYKSRYEEGLLHTEYAEYVTYMQHTNRFIPYFWLL